MAANFSAFYCRMSSSCWSSPLTGCRLSRASRRAHLGVRVEAAGAAFQEGRRADHSSRLLPGRLEARLSSRRRHQHREDHRGEPEQCQEGREGQRMHSKVSSA